MMACAAAWLADSPSKVQAEISKTPSIAVRWREDLHELRSQGPVKRSIHIAAAHTWAVDDVFAVVAAAPGQQQLSPTSGRAIRPVHTAVFVASGILQCGDKNTNPAASCGGYILC